MITFDNVTIQANLDEVLVLLRVHLLERGIECFRTVKTGLNNTQVTCPFHKDGKESKPSFGINNTTGQCHCFTCGWSGNLDVMISEILGRDDKGKYGRKWLQANFNNFEIETRQIIKIPQRKLQLQASEQVFVTEEELDSYRYFHPYMYKRGLNDAVIEKFDIGYDEKTNCITFPCCDKNGNCLFIARRSVATKYFNYPTGADKPLYAYHFAKTYKKVWVVESMLNCLTCWKNGIPAIALIGLGSSTQIQELLNSNIRHFVLALDPDDRGRAAQEKLRKKLCKTKIISEVVYPDLRDVNDLGRRILRMKEIF